MKKSSFLQRQLFITLIGTLVLVMMGFAIAFWAMRPNQDKQSGPGVYMAQFLQALSKKMPFDDAVDLVSSSGRTLRAPPFAVLDESGAVLKSNLGADAIDLKLEIAPQQLPQIPNEVVNISIGKNLHSANVELVKVETNPVRYLAFVRPRGRLPGPPGLFSTIIAFVTIAAILSALLSFAVLVYYLRKNSLVIEDVISEIHRGNLKARFPVRKLDEVGQVMTKFNRMADEIEQLVNRVREQEKVRLHLLQELGHDLRTPLASLGNLIETLDRKSDSLTEQQKREITSVSVSEIGYVSQLVEDLLFLARVDDPKYTKDVKRCDPVKLLREEVDSLNLSQTDPIKKILFSSRLPENTIIIADEHLFRRLFKNLLDNALTYARSEIRVQVEEDNDGQAVQFLVEDDGPGFGTDVLKDYGTKRMQRSVTETAGRKISLGLGSVIVRAVAEAHRGTVVATNRTDGASGARVQVTVPRES